MRGGARVLPGVRCFRGAAVFGVGGAAVFGVGGAAVLGGAAAVFGVGGAAAVFGVGGGFWRTRRGGGFGRCGAARRFLAWSARRQFAQSFGGALAPLGSPPCFAAVIPRAGLCAGLLCRARARIINFSLI